MFTIFSSKPTPYAIQRLSAFNIGYAVLQLFQHPEQAPMLGLEIMVHVSRLLALSDRSSLNERRVGAALNLMIGLYYAQNVTPTSPRLIENMLDAIAGFTCGELILHEMVQARNTVSPKV